MKLIWTKNKLPLSWLIRKGLSEPVSHVAIVFDDKLVFHSNLFGAHIEWYSTFKTHNTVVSEKDFPLEYTEDSHLFDAVANRFDGKPYDFRGFLYFCWCAILWRLLGKPFPKYNKLGITGALLCTEVLSEFPAKFGLEEGVDLCITSPYQLWVLINKEEIK